MDRIRIVGGKRLDGEVEISGSKNATLPLMAASLLGEQPSRIGNVPRLRDIDAMKEMLEFVGAEQPIEIPVPELVNGDSFRPGDPRAAQKIGATSEECGIFHAAGAAVVCRIHTCDGRIGVITQPKTGIFESVFNRVQIAVFEPSVVRLKQQGNLGGFVGSKGVLLRIR